MKYILKKEMTNMPAGWEEMPSIHRRGDLKVSDMGWEKGTSFRVGEWVYHFPLDSTYYHTAMALCEKKNVYAPRKLEYRFVPVRGSRTITVLLRRKVICLLQSSTLLQYTINEEEIKQLNAGQEVVIHRKRIIVF